MRSLMIKMAMLAATAAIVMWVGWPAEEVPSNHDAPVAVEESTASTRSSGDGPVLARTHEPPASPTKPGAAGRLDINRATVEQFEKLPGIGLTLAKRIIEQRMAHGPFRSVEDLRSVKGIGEKRMERLRPLLVASGAGESRSSLPRMPEAARRGPEGL